MVWVSAAPAHPSNLRPLTHSFREPEEKLDFARECRKRNEAGESLGPECFPEEIFGAPHAKESNYGVPHLFFAGSYWGVSKAAADVLRQFDLGGGALYPVRFLKKDRNTPVPGEWFCLNFGNTKAAFLPEESHRVRAASGGKQWTAPFVPRDGDIAVGSLACAGPDIWTDPKVRDAFFLSDALRAALKKAKADKGFFLTKCRVVEGA